MPPNLCREEGYIDKLDSRLPLPREKIEVSKPKLYLHVGPGKTGSSSIQSFLEKNRENLMRQGFSYPPASYSTSFSGNASDIVQLLFKELTFEEKSNLFEERLKSYTFYLQELNCQNLIISNELFANSSLESLVFFAACAEKHFDIVTICYVRNPYWWIWSNWNQSIKASAYRHSFAVYAYEQGHMFAEVYLNIINAFKDLILLPYSKEVVGDFCRALGLVDMDWVAATAYLNANRGLSFEETSLLMRVNEVFGDAELSWLISEEFLSTFPNANPLKIFYPEIAEHIQQLTSNVVDRLSISSIFKSELKMAIEERGSTSTDLQTDMDHIDFTTFYTIIRAFKKWTEKNSAVHALTRVLLEKPEANLANSLPGGFNSVEYLLLNHDVLAARSDPVYHYLRYGAKEKRSFLVSRSSCEESLGDKK